MQDNPTRKYGIEPRYTLSYAARLLRITPQRLRSWVVDYGGGPGRYPQAAAVPLDSPDLRPIYLSYFNLIEAYFVSNYRSLGVPMQRVRRALNHTRAHEGIDRPLLDQRFQTDGTNLFLDYQTGSGEDLCINVSEYTGQPIWKPIISEYFRSIVYNDFGPVDFWPLTRAKPIRINPRIRFGVPVISRTGVPTEAIFDRAQAGDPRDFLAEDFDLTLAEIDEAIEWEESLQMAA